MKEKVISTKLSLDSYEKFERKASNNNLKKGTFAGNILIDVTEGKLVSQCMIKPIAASLQENVNELKRQTKNVDNSELKAAIDQLSKKVNKLWRL